MESWQLYLVKFEWKQYKWRRRFDPRSLNNVDNNYALVKCDCTGNGGGFIFTLSEIWTGQTDTTVSWRKKKVRSGSQQLIHLSCYLLWEACKSINSSLPTVFTPDSCLCAPSPTLIVCVCACACNRVDAHIIRECDAWATVLKHHWWSSSATVTKTWCVSLYLDLSNGTRAHFALVTDILICFLKSRSLLNLM